MNPPTILHLVRHGETEWNRAGRMQGHGDSPLTDQGHAQARALAARLVRLPHPPEVVVSSDLLRARVTASYAAQALGLECGTLPELRERNLGVFEGLTLPEIEARHPEDYAAWRGRHGDHAIPGGETLVQRDERVVAACVRLVREHPGRRILAITHGGCLDGFWRHVTGTPHGARRPTRLPNAALNTFEHHEGRWTLLLWGDTAHFDHLP